MDRRKKYPKDVRDHRGKSKRLKGITIKIGEHTQQAVTNQQNAGNPNVPEQLARDAEE